MSTHNPVTVIDFLTPCSVATAIFVVIATLCLKSSRTFLVELISSTFNWPELLGPRKIVIVVGRTGAGKSTLLNILCGRDNKKNPIFQTGDGLHSVTKDIGRHGRMKGTNIYLYDAPGLGDISQDSAGRIINHTERIFQKIGTFVRKFGGVIMFVTNDTRLHSSVQNDLKALQRVTVEKFSDSVVLVLTRREKAIDETAKDHSSRMQQEVKELDNFVRATFHQGFADFFYYGYDDLASRQTIIKAVQQRVPLVPGIDPQAD